MTALELVHDAVQQAKALHEQVSALPVEDLPESVADVLLELRVATSTVWSDAVLLLLECGRAER